MGLNNIAVTHSNTIINILLSDSFHEIVKLVHIQSFDYRISVRFIVFSIFYNCCGCVIDLLLSNLLSSVEVV
jgi:hypothetical protein